MKLGLLTAAFPELTLDEIAQWAATHGFDALEVACWPAGEGAARRYAGVSHIDVENVDVAAVRGVVDRHGLEISALAYYPTRSTPKTRRARPRTRTCAR
jgi:sugar phosphate isomerase/epimerase